jgi:hypothetical protein
LGDDAARLPGTRLRRLSQRKDEGGRRLRQERKFLSLKAAHRAAFFDSEGSALGWASN